MGPRARRALTAAAALTALGAAPDAHAFEASLYTRHRFFAESLAEEVTRTQPRYSRTSTDALGRLDRELAYQLQVVGRLAVRPVDWLGLEVGLDTGLVSLGRGGARMDGIALGERLKETLLLGETFAELQLGEAGMVQVRAGKLIVAVGDGVVFDGYGLGVELDVDPSYADPEWQVFGRARALLADATFTAAGKQSPLFELELGRRFGDHGTAAVFGALFVDGGDELEPVMRSALFSGRLGQACDRRAADAVPCDGSGVDVATRGLIGWTGVHGRWRSERLEVRGAAVLQWGSVDARLLFLDAQDRVRSLGADIALSGALGSLEATWRVVDALALRGFGIAATGEGGFVRRPAEQGYGGFLALTPRLPLTALFYGGGLSTTLQSLTVSAVSPNGSGLVSGGAGVEVTPWGDAVVLALSGALMAATHARPSGGFYGAEVDARVDVALSGELALFGSGALFVPGGYYGDVPLGVQVFLGGTLALGD